MIKDTAKTAVREVLEILHRFTSTALDKNTVLQPEDDEEMFRIVKAKMQEIDVSASSEVHARLDAICTGINQIGEALEAVLHSQTEATNLLKAMLEGFEEDDDDEESEDV
jgi:hypothetical protein